MDDSEMFNTYYTDFIQIFYIAKKCYIFCSLTFGVFMAHVLLENILIFLNCILFSIVLICILPINKQ